MGLTVDLRDVHVRKRKIRVRKAIKKIKVKRLNKTFVIYKMSEENFPILGYITEEWYHVNIEDVKKQKTKDVKKQKTKDVKKQKTIYM